MLTAIELCATLHWLIDFHSISSYTLKKKDIAFSTKKTIKIQLILVAKPFFVMYFNLI